MQPVALAHNVCAEYRRYIETTFPILDEALRRQINEKINEQSLLWKGPYVSLSRPFTRGTTVNELAREGVLSPQAATIFADWTLYDHQERATRRLAAQQHTIVASSTGSGKTEAFLIPIIDHCLRNQQQSGTKAVLMYPMNALANDQLKRLRRLLAGTGITFAKYTGDTKQHLARNERPDDAPDEEAVDRESIQARPPDILLTNYAMLELLLLRREDQQIFRQRQVRYLVLDEVHTYGGARGIEVACLIRRFKEHVDRTNGGLVCVGTSATVRGDDIGEVSDFASKLFAEPFTQEAIILEQLDAPKPLHHAYWPPAPQLDERALTDFEPTAGERVLRLAERLCGRAVPPGDTLSERLWRILEENALLRLLEEHLTIPRALDELVAYLHQQPRRDSTAAALINEITAYLLVGSLAIGPQGPRLRPKVHMFYRGLEGFTRCLNCQRVWEAGMDRCPFCDGRCLPLEVCRSCGQDFWRGITTRELSPDDAPLARTYKPPRQGQPFITDGLSTPTMNRGATRDSGVGRLHSQPRAYEVQPDESRDSTPGRTLHLTLTIHRIASLNEDDEGEDADDEPAAASKGAGNGKAAHSSDSPLREIYVCGHCGHATLEPTLGNRCVNCEGTACRMHYHPGRISQCPACQGRYGSREIVTTFGTSVAASIAVLTSAIMKRLDEQERRLLIFSDSRQDTAFQAGYLADKHGQFTKRQLIYQVVDDEARQGNPAVGLADLPRLLYNYGVRLGLFERERRERELNEIIRRETWPILAEFARGGNRRLSLEGLGLIRTSYHRLRESLANNDEAQEFAREHHLTLDELHALAATILDEMRTRRALDHPLLTVPIQFREEKVEGFDRDLRPIGYGYSAEPRGHAYKILPLANKQGSPTQLQVYLRKTLKLEDNAAADMPVKELMDILKDLKYLRMVDIGKPEDHKEALMVDHRRIELAPVRAGEGYECNACRRVYAHNVRDICPAMRCAGTLRHLRPKQENYYVHSYLERQLVQLTPHEHSGQLDGRTREKYEEAFREGSVNILVCTPTMELGVDIGDLPTVMMRNVPPSPANYAQRSGRAGRAERIALIGTFAQNRGHDSYYYDRPADMIRGVVRAPVFGFDNQRIIQRHLHALILEKLDAQFPSVLGKMVDDDDKLTGTRPLIDELKQRHTVIQAAVAAAFARDTSSGGLPWLTRDYVGHVIDAFPTALERTFRPWLIERRSIIDAIDAIPTRRPTPEQKKRLGILQTVLYKMEEDPMRAYTLSYLARQGFLPAYVFVGDQMRMIIPGDARDPLMRGQEQGITEFAPGNLVYYDGYVYSITGLDFQRSDAPERDTQYRICPDGHWLTLVPTAQHCEICEQELKAHAYIEPRSFQGSPSRLISAAEETRARQGYAVAEYLLTEGDTGEKRFGPAGFDLTYHRNTTIFVANTGFNHSKEDQTPNGFSICPTCGQWRDPHQPEWEQRHSKRCTGITRRFHLAYKLDTDVLEIDIPAATFPRAADGNVWDRVEAAENYPITLRNALVLGANLVLQTQEDEIAGFERRVPRDSYEQQQIILYDDVPGGSGYVERLSHLLPEAAAAVLERLEQCACVDSCYRCLRTYYNQLEHRQLDKRLVLDVLRQLA